MPGWRAAILGPDGAELAARRAEGRLAVIGPVGCRYLDDERQANYVVGGWNVTGDTFTRDEDGYFYYRARTDNMIVSSGYNIGGPEVEAVIDSHPDVVESAVVGRPDADRGTAVCAFVVLQPGVIGDAAKARELQDYVKAQLAPYKYPRDVRFTDALPRSATGKLQHFRLRRPGRGGNRMKVAIAGGGPGGLYFAALMKQLDPAHEMTVWERNAAEDTFGFGVVFSDETLGGIESADTVVYGQMESEFARWTDIDIEFNGSAFTVGGQGFAALSRKRLLQILQARARAARRHGALPGPGAGPRASSAPTTTSWSPPTASTRPSAPGTPTCSRRRLTCGSNKYIWLGTDRVFEAFQFFVKQTDWGTMQIHGYPYSDSGSTFIVEMHEDVWRRAGFDATEGRVSRARCLRRARGHKDRGDVRRRTRRPRGADQQLQVAQLHHRPQPALARRQRRAAWRRRPHRALLDRVGHQAGHGGRARAGRLPARAPRRGAGADGLRERAQAGGGVDPAGGPGLAGVVREHRHVRAARTRRRSAST